MSKLYEKCFHKSLKTFYLLIGFLCIISDKCINCWSLQDSVAAAYTSAHSDQIELNFSILEGVPIGTLIGVIKSTNSSIITQPPYLIVPLPGGVHKSNSSGSLGNTGSGGGVDTDLTIDQSTCEIRTAVQLDREQRAYYAFIAIPLAGANIKVIITIEDINDNSPQFPTNEIDLEFPENSKPRDVKRALPPARDLDLGQFGTQKYRIVSGNIGNAFRLLSHREKDEVLYLDLQVNGPLDRETISTYTLVIEALDGGQPQHKDEMTVRIVILDHNDCEPVFSQSHYYENVAENVTLGTSLLRVTATDNDQGDNGLITYSIHSKSSALSSLSTHFEINKTNGWIYVVKPLDFESQELHELVVIARDSGAQPLETSAYVSVRVTDINDNQPTIGLLFLTENGRPEIPENARVGDLVARISVNDADSSGSNSESSGETITGLSVSLVGSDESFGLTSQDNVIHLIVVTAPLSRHKKSKYSLTVLVTDQGNPPLNATTTFQLDILDIDLEKPELKNEAKPPQKNERITPLSTPFELEILDTNNNPLHFERDAYDLNVLLGTPAGVIVATLRTMNPNLGQNGTVYYSFTEDQNLFAIEQISGSITTKHSINEAGSYKLSIVANNGPKKSKVKKLNIDVVNKKLDHFMYETTEIHSFDVIESTPIGEEVGSFNIPIPNSNEYSDNCRNGFSTYLSSGQENLPFLMDSNNGPNLKLIVSNEIDFETKNAYDLIACTDFDQCSLSLIDNEDVIRGKKQCKQYIKIKINVIDDENDCNPFPMDFNTNAYEIKVPLNNINKYRRLTDVLHLNATNCQNIKYEINSPLIADDLLKRLFTIDGNVLQFKPSDHSVIQKLLHEEFVITLLAKKGDHIYRSIPVRVRLLSADKRIGNIGFMNDKYIELDEDCCKVGTNIIQLRINVSHEDFIIKYELNDYSNANTDFKLNSETGFLSLNRELDFERRQEYRINVTAFVHDIKGLLISISSIITIKVINCNDESPVFVRKIYEKEVSENVNLDALLLQVEAKDSDNTGFANLTYVIPEGYRYSDYFNLNKRSGELRLIKQLDREEYQSFNIPIYAFDENFKHYALTYARIKLIDVNDNTPYFLNTNYEIKIPESIAPGTLFHTFIALDKDLHGSGASKSGLTYRIVSGNTANKFSLHSQKGELSTNAALDREKQNIYHLVVEVSDSLHFSNCNLTIELTDVNDNAPIFDKTNYYAIIDNTISGYTNVVTVRAIDSDGDPVLYAINITNEYDSYFFMDSKTGDITVHTPSLTFISKAYNSNVFIFDVLAIEMGSGAYESHITKATVHVTLLNNGHNLMPRLKSYPYIISVGGSKSEYRVGTEIGTIELIDSQSTQTENIIYRVVSNGEGHHSFMDYFNIHSQSGAVVVKRPLNHEYYEAIIEVSKSGNNQLATRALLQVFVGGIDKQKKVNDMHFKVDLTENMPIGTEIINLGLRSRTFNQKYVYTFAYSSVNYSYLNLNQNTGVITLEESLDFESKPSFIEVLVFGRKSLNSIDSYYLNVTIELINVDDNAPQFTQKHYISSIKEGEVTGSFVAQISAIDIDNNKQTNSGRKPVTYHILEGNHDNAFTIDPPGSGIIRTNTVLDREIRDHYFLKIVANHATNNDNTHNSDSESNFQLSSHCTLEILVIDVNDNIPVFPPYQEIIISETEEVGAIVTTLTANDVDTFPMLTYQKQRTNNLSDSSDLFDIGLYTGKITLKSRLSETNAIIPENMTNRYVLNIASSDSKHTVETKVIINVKRKGSQQKPIFTNESNFFVKIDAEDNNCVFHSKNCDIFRVTTFENKDINKKVLYSLGPESGSYRFYMDQYKGIIYNNQTLESRNSKIFNLIIYAKYSGNEEVSQASLVIRVLGTKSQLLNKTDRIFTIETDITKIGKTVLKLPKISQNYAIIGPNKHFSIFRGNELVLTKRPLKEEYSLRITPNNNNQNNSIVVNIRIRPSNEDKTSHNAFKSTKFDVEINENEAIGIEVLGLKPIANNDKTKYRIFSGNELSDFRIDENNGIIYVNHLLNFEIVNNYRLGVVAEIRVNHSQTVHSFAIININVINVNEHCPQFPISHYKTIIDENVAIGTKVIKLNAFDLDNDSVNYTIIKTMDTITPFSYDYRTGYLVTTDLIDYESIDGSPPVFKLKVKAMDSGSGHTDCSVETFLEIQIGSIDEHSPHFTSESYSFKGITANGVSQIKVGQVLASDADKGPDGRVVYTLRSTSPTNVIDFFTVNSSTGTIFMTTTGLDFQRHFSLIISASSGRPHSMNALAVVDVNLSVVSEGSDISGVIRAEDNTRAVTANPISLPGWILFLIVLLMLITVVLLVSIVVIRLHQQQQQQHYMSDHVRNISAHNIGSLLRKIGTFGGTDPNLASYQSHHTSHYGTAPPVPPCYNDVTLSSSAALGSGEGHSASSGRGSAEEEEVEEDIDDVDEEIRMINENSNYYEEDGDSDVTTTAEYLARLGVINHHEEDRGESSTALEDEEEDDMLEQLGAISTPRISSIRGQRRNRVGTSCSSIKSEDWSQINGSMSSIVQSEEELSGSYNWDYLQNWGPKYQPLSSVFAEIARLKATNGEHDLSAVEAMAVECGSTRSSSTTSSSQRMSHRHPPHPTHPQIPPQITARVLSVHPTPTFTPQINSAFQPFNPLNSPPNIQSRDLNNGLTVDEEIRI